MCATLAMAANSLCLFGVLGGLLPSFDGQAAATVGLIVAVATVVVLVVAIATPFIAIAGGATIVGTALAIGGIAVVTGAIAGTASGLYWGHQGDLEIARNKERVMQLSNHLDICFESSADDKTLASPFCCTLVTYDEAQGSKAVPVIEENRRVVVANNSDEFYHAVDVELRRWFGKRVLGDERGLRRVVTVYMKPYPGDGVWDRLQAMVQEHGGTPTRTDGPLAIRQAEPLQ
jgi:hypothetical protein